MRIGSIRIAPVARVLAIVYAVFGFVMWLQYAFGRIDELTLPFGVVAPLFFLNLNFHRQRSSGVFYNLFLCIASVLFYAATGWITGAAAAFSFNFVAKRIGGIDARYFTVSVSGDDPRSGEENRSVRPIDLDDNKLGAKG